jgi:hypothetical protein
LGAAPFSVALAASPGFLLILATCFVIEQAYSVFPCGVIGAVAEARGQRRDSACGVRKVALDMGLRARLHGAA